MAPMRIAVAIVALLAICTIAEAQTSKNGFEVRTLSTRPDLISGGDVLVQVTVPATLAAEKLAVSVNGHDISGEVKLAPQSRVSSEGQRGGQVDGNTFVGLVKDLPVGRREIEA